eukprot:TRINITY_DN11575_c0_g1_i1.p1 TRINITY_DN11575_c0_g1~~TRINITY_DN11575_c0_g1_i1.p1  ORF type:complete len:255 (+),score=46.91 TRINITY_DN11575_c0_g1_i1:76-840(+)
MAACLGASQAAGLVAQCQVPSPQKSLVSQSVSSSRISSSHSLSSSATSFAGRRQCLQAALPGVEQAFGRLSISCEMAPEAHPNKQLWRTTGLENRGKDLWNRTYYPKLADHLKADKQWFIVDAADKRLGRLACAIAMHIRGKHLPTYTPSVDMGAYVIVINAEKVGVTGAKRSQKLYHRHSGRPGGMTVETFEQLQSRIPERIVEKAVKGMLPKGRLGRELFRHLKVYKGEEHPHAAQEPLPLPLHDKLVNMPA